jgi:pyruvate,water dikinase
LFTERAMAYRDRQGFQHMKVALSVGVQKMVRADLAGAGVMFTIDTETGFPETVLIDAGWGLGEGVVKGVVTPDEYRVFKPLLAQGDLVPIIQKRLGSKRSKIVCGSGSAVRTIDTSEEERRRFVLTDGQILQLARWGVDIEEHYGRPMDVEWAIDGDTETMYVLQARPETVESRKLASALKT